MMAREYKMRANARYPVCENGYPTEKTLQYLHRVAGEPRLLCEMFRVVIAAWAYRTAGYYRRRGRTIWLSTAGWSGNESLISAIDGTFNWFITAYSWRRGGHYVFKLPPYIKRNEFAKLPKGGEG